MRKLGNLTIVVSSGFLGRVSVSVTQEVCQPRCVLALLSEDVRWFWLPPGSPTHPPRLLFEDVKGFCFVALCQLSGAFVNPQNAVHPVGTRALACVFFFKLK